MEVYSGFVDVEHVTQLRTRTGCELLGTARAILWQFITQAPETLLKITPELPF
jgi:hypothetical protein